VGRDLARHPDRNALAAVDQQVGDARGQHLGLDFALVVVGAEIDGLFVDVFEQRGRDARQTRFGVPHGRGRIAVHRAEISLAIHQRVAHREGLRHADQGIVDRNVAMRVILAEYFAGDLGALSRGAIVVQPHLVHAIKNAPVHGLEAIANVGQRSAHDHAHGVIEIRPLHLVFDVDGDQVLRAAVAWRAAAQWDLPTGRPARRWRGRVLGICQMDAPR
jgi:hypothetical protein